MDSEGIGNEDVILWLDPSLTIIAAVLLWIFAIQPLKDNALVLILAVPPKIDVDRLQETFKRKFPHCDSQDLKIYLQSRNEVNVSVRIRHKIQNAEVAEQRTENDFTKMSNNIKEFFASHGANGRIFVQPEFHSENDDL